MGAEADDSILRQSYDACALVSKREAKNFYFTFRLLPAPLRRSMCALYAFMRHIDDVSDEPGPIEPKRQVLADWRLSLERGEAVGPVIARLAIYPAIRDTVQRHAIPTRYLLEVVDGVEMDLAPVAIQTFDDLYAYCYRVASAVGLCCLHIWGFESHDGEAERRAEACGIALQLTNIIRDVREDAQRGRVYLPGEELDRFGVRPEMLAQPTVSEPLRALLAFQADRAYSYYERGRGLTSLVAPVGRPVLLAITGIYRALLDEIVRRRYEVLAERTRVASWRKAWIAVQALRPQGVGR